MGSSTVRLSTPPTPTKPNLWIQQIIRAQRVYYFNIFVSSFAFTRLLTSPTHTSIPSPPITLHPTATILPSTFLTVVDELIGSKITDYHVIYSILIPPSHIFFVYFFVCKPLSCSTPSAHFHLLEKSDLSFCDEMLSCFEIFIFFFFFWPGLSLLLTLTIANFEFFFSKVK